MSLITFSKISKNSNPFFYYHSFSAYCVIFLESLSAGDVYDARDVERFKEDDRYAKCFVRSFWKGGEENFEEAAAKVDEILKYRKSINLNGKYIKSCKVHQLFSSIY